jgi:hypothetical protein
VEQARKFLEEAYKLLADHGYGDHAAVARAYLDDNDLSSSLDVLQALGERFVEGSEMEACFWRPLAKAAALLLNESYAQAGQPPAGST